MRISNDFDIHDILFLDIETVSQFQDLEDAPEQYQLFWERKAARFMDDEDTPSSVYDKSAIFSEFGRILAISLGYYHLKSEGGETFRVACFVGDEKLVLSEFCKAVEAFAQLHKRMNLCAHNGKEFDFPYIARRLLINGLELPTILQVAGRRPWETGFLDTFELWKFGDYKHFTSLSLLAYVFGISELMEDMEGSRIYETFYIENNLLKIAEYCQRDTVTCAQLLRKMLGMPIAPSENIIYLPPSILADSREEECQQE